jgi:hypothetical protein
MESESDDYGFFCDLESAKIMEYEKVDFYIVKVSKKYEVRRYSSGVTDLAEGGKSGIFGRCSSNENAFFPHPISQDKSQIPFGTVLSEESIADDDAEKKPIGLGKIFACLARLPRDIYYSFMVCTITASCVYLVMTI